VIYVRQSSLAQVREHTEPIARQYGPVDHAVALGWDRDTIEVIDTNLGVSGRSTESRDGFRGLVSKVWLRWDQLNHARVLGILNNPCYAGAYVFGRYASRRTVDPDGGIHSGISRQSRARRPAARGSQLPFSVTSTRSHASTTPTNGVITRGWVPAHDGPAGGGTEGASWARYLFTVRQSTPHSRPISA